MVKHEQLLASNPSMRALLRKVPEEEQVDSIITYILTVEEAQSVYLWTPTRSSFRWLILTVTWRGSGAEFFGSHARGTLRPFLRPGFGRFDTLYPTVVSGTVREKLSVCKKPEFHPSMSLIKARADTPVMFHCSSNEVHFLAAS